MNYQVVMGRIEDAQRKDGSIRSFRHRYDFLSNFYPAQVRMDGRTWPSLEHAYQAAKSLDPIYRDKIMACPTAAQTKILGRKVKLRDGWDAFRRPLMRKLLRRKFKDSMLRRRLLSTGDARLVEGNYWHDTFFGKCYCDEHLGKGEDVLGHELMRLRNRIKRGQT